MKFNTSNLPLEIQYKKINRLFEKNNAIKKIEGRGGIVAKNLRKK